MGDFTHPSGREERAGGVTRTIQKVVSVQLQTHPPTIGQTEIKGTQTSRQKPPGQKNIQTIKQRRRARKGQNTVRRDPDYKEPVKDKPQGGKMMNNTELGSVSISISRFVNLLNKKEGQTETTNSAVKRQRQSLRKGSCKIEQKTK